MHEITFTFGTDFDKEGILVKKLPINKIERPKNAFFRNRLQIPKQESPHQWPRDSSLVVGIREVLGLNPIAPTRGLIVGSFPWFSSNFGFPCVNTV